MTYVSSFLIPGADLEGFQAIDGALPTTRPAGLMARFVGATPDGLAITAVWSTKAQADRFGAEDLGPTLRRIHGEGSGGQLLIDYEATDVIGPW
jgi:hypothetical protein